MSEIDPGDAMLRATRETQGRPIGADVHVTSMLKRFADAGEIGIERRFVPQRIMAELEHAGYVEIYSTTMARITAPGRSAALGSAERH